MSRFRQLSRLESAIGLGGIAIGLLVLPPSLAFDVTGAGLGILSQLSVTGPALLLVVLASVVNLGAGSVVIAVLGRRRPSGLADLILGAFAGAILMDVALLFLLGSVGLFERPWLIAVHALVLAAGWRPRLGVFAVKRPGRAAISPLLILVAVGWSAPVLLQLASPVVPWADVLANHVSPVEHARAFGTFDPLTTSPSPVYGPSRLFLGFIALQGTIAVLVDLPAALTVSAFIVVETLLVGLGMHRLAVAIGGRRAGMWALVTFMLTHPFARLADDRARVLVLALVAWTFIELIRPRTGRPSRGATRSDRSSGGAALAAAILMHPLLGALTAATLVLTAAIGQHAQLRRVAAVISAAGIAALAQGVVMLGYPLPALAGLVPLTVGLALLHWLPPPDLSLDRINHAPPMDIRLLAVAAVLGMAVGWGTGVLSAAGNWMVELVRFSPLLFGMALLGVVLARRRIAHPIIVAGLAVSAATGIFARSISRESGSLLLRALQFELQKDVIEWAPLFLAVAAATTIVVLLSVPRTESWKRPAGVALVSAFVLVGALPLRPQAIDRFKIGEHRFSENLATSLGFAQQGFWQGFPDARMLVDASQRRIIEVVRREIDRGSVDHRSELLHVAASYLPWSATPVGVFTGMNETVVSLDAAEVHEPLDAIHTFGGRLYPMSDLDALLHRPDHRYALVLLEADALPRGIRSRIVEAGYQAILRTTRGTLYRSAGAASVPGST